MRDHGVTLQAIWFDDREGDVYAGDIAGRSATLMSNEDFGRVVVSLREPTP